MEKIIDALMCIRCGAASTEAQLHEQTEKALQESGIDTRHEVRLGPGARIDFVAGGIGIEVKKNKPDRKKLIEQLGRYGASEEIKGLIVVAPRGVDLPDRICGKPLRVIALDRLWGIGLP